MLYHVLAALYVFACLLLAVCVLLQQGKGGDIASAFGGSSSSQAFGARAGATLLTRATTILGAVFMLGALGLSVVSRAGTAGSVVNGLTAPVAPAQSRPAAVPPLTVPPTTSPMLPAPAAATGPAPVPAPQATTGRGQAAPSAASGSTGRRGGGR